MDSTHDTPRRSLSVAVDDYTKTIDALERLQGGRVTTGDLAKRLGVTRPSVSGMLRKLDDLGYLEYLPYQAFRLTGSGRRHALGIIRRHRLLELFLTEVLGMTWDKVHAEAEQLEHAVSAELCDLIERKLGHPQFDPHGDPIPRRDGYVPDRALHSLSAIPDGTSVRMQRVSDRDPAILRSIAAAGICLGDELERVADNGDSVIVRHYAREIHLSPDIVAAVLVEIV